VGYWKAWKEKGSGGRGTEEGGGREEGGTAGGGGESTEGGVDEVGTDKCFVKQRVKRTGGVTNNGRHIRQSQGEVSEQKKILPLGK